jgi:hypothetical protein
VLAVSSAAAPYRASGLVHWREADLPIARPAAPKASKLGRGDYVAKMAKTNPKFDISPDHMHTRSDY